MDTSWLALTREPLPLMLVCLLFISSLCVLYRQRTYARPDWEFKGQLQSFHSREGAGGGGLNVSPQSGRRVSAPGQRGGQQVWWKQIHHFAAWVTGQRAGGYTGEEELSVWMQREGWMEGWRWQEVYDVILRFSWRVTEVEVITASHHPHSSVTDQSSLSATSSSTATKVPHEFVYSHKKTREILQVLIDKKDKMQPFSTDCTSLALGVVEYKALSFDLAGGQMEMWIFKRHEISIKWTELS